MNNSNISSNNIMKTAANKDRSVSPASPSKTTGGRPPPPPPINTAAGINALLAQEGPSLDPHHVHIYIDEGKVKVAKFDKHPDAKRRRKETVTFEVTQDCLMKEQEKHVDPFFKMDRSSSAMNSAA